MAKLVWDKTGERLYETGVDRGVVYPSNSTGGYGAGAAWNGLTNVTLSPSGAEATPLYANNRKYLNLMSVEELGGNIEAYSYPDEFAECNGTKSRIPGLRIGQQKRKSFGFCFRTMIGNDTDGATHGYKLHLVYGALAAPSESANATINDSPEAKTMSWEFSTTPVETADGSVTSYIVIDSTKVDATNLTLLERMLYASDSYFIPLFEQPDDWGTTTFFVRVPTAPVNMAYGTAALGNTFTPGKYYRNVYNGDPRMPSPDEVALIISDGANSD